MITLKEGEFVQLIYPNVTKVYFIKEGEVDDTMILQSANIDEDRLIIAKSQLGYMDPKDKKSK